MAGPNPILANGRIRIPYLTDEPLTHTMDFYVSLTGAGTPPTLVCADSSAESWHNAVNAILAVLAPAFATGTAFGLAALEKYVSGSYQEIDTFTSSTTNGSGSAGVKASIATLGFRDSLFKLAKLVLLGVNIPAPSKGRAGSAGSTANAIFTDFTTKTTAHSGFYVVSRSDLTLSSGINSVVSFNRKSRRRLGLL